MYATTEVYWTVCESARTIQSASEFARQRRRHSKSSTTERSRRDEQLRSSRELDVCTNSSSSRTSRSKAIGPLDCARCVSSRARSLASRSFTDAQERVPRTNALKKQHASSRELVTGETRNALHIHTHDAKHTPHRSSRVYDADCRLAAALCARAAAAADAAERRRSKRSVLCSSNPHNKHSNDNVVTASVREPARHGVVVLPLAAHDQRARGL